MPRSSWKGPYVNAALQKKIKKQKSKANIKSWDRSTYILPEYENKPFQIYNGKSFVSILVRDKMIGHKFGEFVPTRKNFSFKKAKRKGKQSKI